MEEYRTCLITLHSINNAGSVLQAYALNKYINDLGIENYVIDYRPYYTKLDSNIIKGIVRAVVFGYNQRKLNSKYNIFVSKYMKLTKERYYSLRQLKKKVPNAECFIAGSDQLWNASYKCGKDEAYRLDFVLNKPKISYATSMGRKSIPQSELDILCESIKDYKWISVREESASKLLTQKLGRNVEYVCDPVFLLEKEEYERMINDNLYGDYAVMYLAESSECLDDFIEYIKREKGWRIIQAGGNRKRCNCDIHLKCVGPEDFLSLIKNARFVISGSFHATAFSAMFRKEFCVFLPKNNGERISNFLELLGLNNKVVEANRDFKNAMREIEYSDVIPNLEQFVNKSRMMLKNEMFEIKHSGEIDVSR